jgi:hypothetical protein
MPPLLSEGFQRAVIVMQIALTALITIFVGALTLIAGQIIMRGALENALELKRLIGTIAHDLDFYADRLLQCSSEEQQAWRDKFRKHACSLREKLAFITWYRLFEIIFRLPPKNAVRDAYQLIGYSNCPASPSECLPDEKIKELLRIKTSDSTVPRQRDRGARTQGRLQRALSDVAEKRY